MSDPPIACSLTAADYRLRIADFDQIARAALLDRQAIDGGARLTFAGGEQTRAELEALIAAESRCCPFLSMQLRPAEGRLVLDVTGPDAAAPIIEEMLA